MESDETLKELIQCFREKVPVDGDRMLAVCETFRGQITKNYYPCTLEIYSGLGNMYACDERFIQYYDKHEKGLAEYYNEAIQNYCIKKA